MLQSGMRHLLSRPACTLSQITIEGLLKQKMHGACNAGIYKKR